MRRSSAAEVGRHPASLRPGVPRCVASRACIRPAGWLYLWEDEMSSAVDDFTVELIDDGSGVTVRVVGDVDLDTARVWGRSWISLLRDPPVM